MGQRELKRWHLMEMVKVGKITLREAGERIGVSYRQAKRIKRAIRDRGIKGLVHGNRGRPSNHRIIVTMEEANRFLQSTFLNAFNRRFAVRPRESQKAWRQVPNHLDLDRIISFRFMATVGNDKIGKGDVSIYKEAAGSGLGYRVEFKKIF